MVLRQRVGVLAAVRPCEGGNELAPKTVPSSLISNTLNIFSILSCVYCWFFFAFTPLLEEVEHGSVGLALHLWLCIVLLLPCLRSAARCAEARTTIARETWEEGGLGRERASEPATGQKVFFLGDVRKKINVSFAM